MNAKQILVAACAFFCGAGVVSAASYQPFAPQGGLAITTLLPAVFADGSSGTLEMTARMADSSVQQADANKPNGYARPDSTGALTLPVTGRTTNAPYASRWTLGATASRRLHLGEQGAAMDGSANDEAVISGVLASNTEGLGVVVPYGSWPGANNFHLPDATHGNWYAEIAAGIKNWPAFAYSPNGEGMRIPYYGDGITTVSHNSWNTNGIIVSRVDSNGTGANTTRPMIQNNLVADTPNEQGSNYNSGVRGVDDNLIVTANFTGYANNHSISTYDQSVDGFASQTVGLFNKYYLEGDGNAWAWNRIDEMIDISSINSGHADFQKDGAVTAAHANAEEDMSGIGPEYASTAYDPTHHVRESIWFGLNDDIKGKKWSSNKAFKPHTIITASDASGNLWMYDAGSGGTSGANQPTWPYDATTTVTDGTITWSPLGEYHFDVGAIIGAGGPANTRIGTMMYESGAQIYNAIIDMSQAKFLDGITHIFSRLQPDMYLDLSADGTQAGQNKHLFGYTTANGLVYKIPSAYGHVVAFQVDDTGIAHLQSLMFTDQSKSINSLRDVVQSSGQNNLSVSWDGSQLYAQVDGTNVGHLATTEVSGKWVSPPTSKTSPCTVHQFSADASYHYDCIATNTWVRFAVDSTWQ